MCPPFLPPRPHTHLLSGATHSTQTQVSLRFSSRPFLPPAPNNHRRLVLQSLCYPGPGCVPLTCCGGGRKYHPGQHCQVPFAQQPSRPSDPDRRNCQGQKQDGRSQVSREENFVPSPSTSGLFTHRDKKQRAGCGRVQAGKPAGLLEAALARCREAVTCLEGRRPERNHVGTPGAESQAGIQFGSRLKLEPWRCGRKHRRP